MDYYFWNVLFFQFLIDSFSVNLLLKKLQKLKIHVTFVGSTDFKFLLHPADVLRRFRLWQSLDVSVKIPCWNLCVAAGNSLQQCIINKDVLLLCLHHVVSMRSHQSHVTINIYRLLLLHTLQHGINHNEAARSAHTSTEREREREKKLVTSTQISVYSSIMVV